MRKMLWKSDTFLGANIKCWMRRKTEKSDCISLTACKIIVASYSVNLMLTWGRGYSYQMGLKEIIIFHAGIIQRKECEKGEKMSLWPCSQA